MKEDEKWMRVALGEAEKAFEHSEVPVGAVLIKDGQIIGRGHNRVEVSADPTAHAEIIAIREATTGLSCWRLLDCKIYVTLEPCPMCAGAISLSRINQLIFGAFDSKFGACGSLTDLMRDKRFNHQVEVRAGILEPECKEILRSFFSLRRNKGEVPEFGLSGRSRKPLS